ncbi:MAG: hypothetical protein LBI63_03235 [Candidatus Ancillula sp.]|jgi:hypothetical protein|nr:hypothetical protein [Candidatus Ancillula sp.]
MTTEVDDALKKQVQLMLQLALQVYKTKKARTRNATLDDIKTTLAQKENLELQKQLEQAQDSSYEFLAQFETASREQLELAKTSETWGKLDVTDARNLWVVASVQKDNPHLTDEERAFYASEVTELQEKIHNSWGEDVQDLADKIGDVIKVRNIKDLETTYVVDLSETNSEDAMTSIATEILKRSEEAVTTHDFEAFQAPAKQAKSTTPKVVPLAPVQTPRQALKR